MWGKEDPIDKLSDKMLRKPKCDYCSYRPKNFTDYVQHLKEKHPEGGSTDSGRVTVEAALVGSIALAILGYVVCLAWLGMAA